MKELPTIRYSDIKKATTSETEELVKTKGAHIVTSDGEPKFVIMSVEEYAAFLPVNQNPPRQPKMVRVEGVLFREVI